VWALGPKPGNVKMLIVRKPKFWPRKNGHINKMYSKTEVSHVFYNNPQGSRLRGRPKNSLWNWVQTDSSKCKITDWKEKSKKRTA